MRPLFGFIFATLLLWWAHAMLWPWLGPKLFDPCPLYTSGGALFMAAWEAMFIQLQQWSRDQRYVLKSELKP